MVDCPLGFIKTAPKDRGKTAHLLFCHLGLGAHEAVDVAAACVPMAMEQLHCVLVNSSVHTSLYKGQYKRGT